MSADSNDVAQVQRYVEAFITRYRDRADYWRSQLADCAERGDGFAIWGAGSKGVTFLNVLADTSAGMNSVLGVVDINPLKQGKFVAGTGHEVVAPERIVEIGVDRVVAMNPLYVDEIREQLLDLGYRGTVEAIE